MPLCSRLIPSSFFGWLLKSLLAGDYFLDYPIQNSNSTILTIPFLHYITLFFYLTLTIIWCDRCLFFSWFLALEYKHHKDKDFVCLLFNSQCWHIVGMQ